MTDAGSSLKALLWDVDGTLAEIVEGAGLPWREGVVELLTECPERGIALEIAGRAAQLKPVPLVAMIKR